MEQQELLNDYHLRQLLPFGKVQVSAKDLNILLLQSVKQFYMKFSSDQHTFPYRAVEQAYWLRMHTTTGLTEEEDERPRRLENENALQ